MPSRRVYSRQAAPGRNIPLPPPRNQGRLREAAPNAASRALARDLAEVRIRRGRPGDAELVFGEWSGDD
jgi:hypothetical protein